MAYSRDISALKDREEKLRKSEERFRALVSASSDILYRMSPDWSEMRQLTSQEFLVRIAEPTTDWLHLYIPSEDQEQVKTEINESIRNKSIFELEHRVIRADGTVGWTLSRAVPLLTSDGKIHEWFGAANDITQRKVAEERLAEERNFYDTILNTQGALVTVLTSR